MPLPTVANTLGALQAMQTIIVNGCLIGGVSPFASLSSADATRFGVARAVFVGKPKDWNDGYLPACTLWVPPGATSAQPVEVAGNIGRVIEATDVTVTLYADLRTDWWLAEQNILALRDALWAAVLGHVKLGGNVSSVTGAIAEEGAGYGYETIAGIEYRTYALTWRVWQQWTLTGGVTI